MNKKIAFPELVELIADTTNSSKRLSELFLKELFGTISQALIDGESVKVKSLGTFKLTKVSVRKSVDVNTGEEIEIPSHNKLTFIPDKNLAEAINTPFSQFETTVLSDEVTNEELAAVEQEDDEPAAEAEPVEETASETAAESQTNDELAGDDSYEAEDVNTLGEAIEETERAEMPNENEIVTPPPFVPHEETTENNVPQAPALAAEEVVDKKDDDSFPEVNCQESAPDATVEPETATSDTENVEENAAGGETETIADEETADVPEAAPVQAEVADDEPQAGDSATDSEEDVLEENDDVAETESELPQPQPEAQPQQMVLPSDYQRIEFEKKLKEVTRKSLMRGFLWGVLVAVFACCVIGYLLYTSHGQNQQPPMADIVPDTQVVADSVVEKPAAKQQDTTTEVQKTPVQASDSEKTPAKVVRDTINGRTLMSMSTKHYGKWCFWVYIYEENKSKIANPNNMRPGTVLVIPPAEKYGIDPKNKASVEKAKKKSFEILKRYEQ